ncbi:MAG: exonuclease SbcCD subunit D [Roseburia sp.]|nr:exonuclease SbcCD subunit D [Roseburia sp.]
MKFFHISDLHIGKQLHHYSLRGDQKDILEKIVEAAKREKPDALLLAGDIYDSSVPSAEAVELFDFFLTRFSDALPKTSVLVIAGNHDSGKRLSFASEILKKHRIYVAGLPPVEDGEFIRKVVLEDRWGRVNFYLLPFTKPSHLRKFREEPFSSYQEGIEFLLGREQIDRDERNVILSHQFYTASGKKPIQSDSEVVTVGGIDQVDVSVLKDFDYAALGHIHKPQNMGKTIRYCGTPLAYSVSEADQEKSITAVTLEEKGKEPRICEIPLKPLHRVRKFKGRLQEILEMDEGSAREDYVSITLTDDIEAYEPMEQLKELYHRILELSVDNKRTRTVMDFSMEDVEEMQPLTAFVQFFQEMNGREMSEDERNLAEKIIVRCTVEKGEGA